MIIHLWADVERGDFQGICLSQTQAKPIINLGGHSAAVAARPPAVGQVHVFPLVAAKADGRFFSCDPAQAWPFHG